ncbi:hypothetical protein [Actinomadura sp. 21ATH]|uniref:hypothetical protein n=1 Tax=Actinomadura sp. 21ATH TaxID=1735444 RepID=UPI0035BFD982
MSRSALSHRRPVLAVATSAGNAIHLFDGLTYDPIGDLQVTAQPHELAADTAEGLLYISHTYRSGIYTEPGEKAHEISVADPFRRELLEVVSLAPQEAPHGLALDARRHRLYTTVEEGPVGNGAVVALDTVSRRPVGRIDVGAGRPHWFAATPDGRKGYATNKADPFISVVDLAGGRLVGRIPAPFGTEEVAISRDGRYAYVAGPALRNRRTAPSGAAMLIVIDTATDEVVDRIPLEAPGRPVHVAPDGRVLVGLVRTDRDGGPADGRLAVYSPDAHLLQYSVPTGRSPITIRTTPAGDRAFVANLRSGTVTVVDLESGTEIRTLDIDPEQPDRNQRAHGIAYLE